MAMADGYGLFWNSDSGDRKYDAQSFEKWLKKFFTSGVFEGDLQVLASSGMTVQVQTGYSNVNGKVGLFESATNVTLSAANSRYPRIDTIIIERNDANRVIQIDKVTGAYTGENPQPTAPIWDEAQGIYQLVLAQIYVGAGVSSISQEDITDKRTDTDVCGYIAGTVNEMDFSQFTAQFESYFSTFEATQLAEFEEWFDHMKDQLDSDAAGHLQAEIDATNGNIGTLASLTTDDKTSAVAAINEVDAHADTAQANTNNAQQMIAPIQSNLTASKAYAVGEQFVYNGLLYKATAAIAQGGTITINGNCELADSVTGQIKTLSDDTGIVTLTKGIWYRKRGNEVIVGFDGKNRTNLTNANWTNVGSLPIGYRPSYDIFAVVGLGNLDYYGFVMIDTDGHIDILHRAGSTLSGIWGEAVFMV